jgi:DNA-binding NarL/FixJ family response regulator
VGQIRILIADDNELVRLGIRSVLAELPDFLIVSEAANGLEAITKAKETQPDVVLLDLSMPELNGIAAVRVISEIAPDARVVIVTEHESPVFIRQSFTAGACGFLPKADLAKELAVAIREVNRGGTFLPERLRVAAAILATPTPSSPATSQNVEASAADPSSKKPPSA